MNKRKVFFVSVTCMAFLASCSYNKDELVQPGSPGLGANSSTGENPSGAVVTYTSHVKTIIDNNCIGCHGGQGGLFLTNYSQVKAIADNGNLLLRAIQGGGPQPMPPSGVLPQATLDTLQFWLDQNALE